ncbi:MAG: folylpolyglutamate synthase/dihydrofolate synthase family protein [Pseudomonadota bacterium]
MTASPAAGSDLVLERLSRLHPKVIDLTLDRVWRLLDLLGNPQERLPPVVHVAGTNGKGSTIATLRAMAEAQGLRVHVYTSPHLVRFHERVRIAGRLISEDDLIALLEECERVNGPEPITFFEITTVAALLAFTRTPADLLLLEVGLGGRLDATNVIPKPALSIITPVSMDHMAYLGDTLEKIAFEKAGILKADVPAVIAPQRPGALAVIEAQAAKVGAPLYRAGQEWDFAPTERGLRVGGQDYPGPSLVGAHQMMNAGTAVMAAEVLGESLPALAISATARAAGLREIDWPGRLQQVGAGALLAQIPRGWELWFDGGHNEEAGAVLGAQMEAWSDRPVHVIYGLLNSKAAADFLAPIASCATSLQAIAIPGEPNSLSAEEAAASAPGAVPRESVEAALACLPRGDGPARVLICGSLYLIGKLLAKNGALTGLTQGLSPAAT